jgi:predicted NUDIX family NTP pyrophosphohydrolase
VQAAHRAYRDGMVEHSAGVLLRRGGSAPRFFVVHMGGPFWRRRERAWSIPKGLVEPGESALEAARREFAEELGVPVPDAVELVEVGEFRQASGKRVTVFAGEVGPDGFSVDAVRSSTFTLELPRGSGRMVEFPEVDDASWVTLDEARAMLVLGQVPAVEAVANGVPLVGDGTTEDPAGR